MEEKVAKLMKKWGCTEEEAREMIAWDEQTDKMTSKEINAEMTPEQRKAAKSARITTSGKKTERKVERKPNDEKRWLIDIIRVLFEGMENNGKMKNVSVSNPERQVDFVVGDTEYSITLTAHRKPKK